MSRRLSNTIEFVSIHVVTAYKKVCGMTDDECGKWVKKALMDMALGCPGNDVDPMVMSAYEDSVRLVEKSREQKRASYERRKSKDGNVKKPDQLVYGTFGNVHMTQDEYNDLLQRVGNVNSARKMIDNLSAKLEDGSQESSNHYATLVYWSQCREQRVEEKPRYVSAADKTMQVYEEGLKLIHEKYGNG